MPEQFDTDRFLWVIRFVHTVIWIVFAGAVVAIFPAVFAGALDVAAGLSVLVWLEVVILAVSGWRCPLNTMAARLTDERRDGFDIFLPGWLARNTKVIFGTLFVVGEALLLWRWFA